MSTLLLVSLYEFKQFLQIVLWIAIPGTIIAIAITTVLHYRRKKNLQGAAPEVDDQGRLLLTGSDMISAYAEATADKADNTPLLKKYEREIRRYKENYSTLEQDFRALEEKYTGLLNKAYHNDQSGNESMDKLHQEIKGYKLKIAQLQQASEFKQENNTQENANAQDPMELHDLRIKHAQLEEENNVLKERLEETQYIHEVLQEKKLQTEFLQQQLELRIKNFHQVEKQAGSATAELAQLRLASEEYNNKEQALREELLLLHEQQSTLQNVITEKQEAIRHLEQSIESEQQRSKELEGKLELSSQLFVRIYAELEKSLDAGVLKSQNGNPAAILGPTAN